MVLHRSEPLQAPTNPVSLDDRSQTGNGSGSDRDRSGADTAELSSHRVHRLGFAGPPTGRFSVFTASPGTDAISIISPPRLPAGGRRVVCPDLPGRGQSERLKDGSDYVLPQYCGDMTVLIAALGSIEVDWVGTSLGGLIGMVLAALPNSPIRRIVINDIGPYLPWAGLLRLGANLNEAPKSFETIEAAELYFRRVLAPFGELEDEHWRHLAMHSVEWKPERQRFESLCDPNIAHAFRNPWHYSVDLWKYWDAIGIPILVVRGQKSDLLPEDVLPACCGETAMPRRTVQNCGHAPALIAPDQIELVARFLGDNPG